MVIIGAKLLTPEDRDHILSLLVFSGFPSLFLSLRFLTKNINELVAALDLLE